LDLRLETLRISEETFMVVLTDLRLKDMIRSWNEILKLIHEMVSTAALLLNSESTQIRGIAYIWPGKL
jgi:hypothetical protein